MSFWKRMLAHQEARACKACGGGIGFCLTHRCPHCGFDETDPSGSRNRAEARRASFVYAFIFGIVAAQLGAGSVVMVMYGSLWERIVGAAIGFAAVGCARMAVHKVNWNRADAPRKGFDVVIRVPAGPDHGKCGIVADGAIQ